MRFPPLYLSISNNYVSGGPQASSPVIAPRHLIRASVQADGNILPPGTGAKTAVRTVILGYLHVLSFENWFFRRCSIAERASGRSRHPGQDPARRPGTRSRTGVPVSDGLHLRARYREVSQFVGLHKRRICYTQIMTPWLCSRRALGNLY